MDASPARMSKGLFGFRAKDVRKMLADREAMLRLAQQQSQEVRARAEQTSELRTREAERMRADLSGAVSQYVRWRQRLEAIMTAVQDRLDEAQSRISEVPKRIQEALAPMSDAIYLFNEDLTTMSQVG